MELAITIAIVGILAAIAVPTLLVMKLKAKRAEAPSVLAGIRDAEGAYFVAHSEWIEGATNPGTALTKNLRAWDPALAGWSDLNFRPDGMVRCNYSANCQGGSGCGDADTYVRLQATCDVDDDNATSRIYLYVGNGRTGCCGSFAPGQVVWATPGLY